MVAMFVNGQEQNEHSLQRTFHRFFIANLGSLGKAISEENIFQKSTNQKQKLPVAAMFVNGSRRYELSLQKTFHRCFLPNFGFERKMIYKTLHRKRKIEQLEPHKNWMSRSCCTSGTCRVSGKRHKQYVIQKSCWTPVYVNTYK